MILLRFLILSRKVSYKKYTDLFKDLMILSRKDPYKKYIDLFKDLMFLLRKVSYKRKGNLLHFTPKDIR